MDRAKQVQTVCKDVNIGRVLCSGHLPVPYFNKGGALGTQATALLFAAPDTQNEQTQLRHIQGKVNTISQIG